MNTISIIKTTGKNLPRLFIGNNKDTIIKKMGGIVAGALATVGTKIYLETLDNKYTINIEQGDAKQSANFIFDENENLISAESIYNNNSKDEIYHFDNQKTSSKVIYHTQPLTADTPKSIDIINHTMAQTIGYKSYNTDFNSGDTVQMSSTTAQRKFPEIFNMILALLPDSNTDMPSLKLNIKDKYRKHDGTSILGFSTQDKSIKGLLSSTGNVLTYHVNTPNMTVIGETSNDNEVNYTYLNNENTPIVAQQNVIVTQSQEPPSDTVPTNIEIPTTNVKSNRTKIQKITDFIQKVLGRDSTETIENQPAKPSVTENVVSQDTKPAWDATIGKKFTYFIPGQIRSAEEIFTEVYTKTITELQTLAAKNKQESTPTKIFFATAGAFPDYTPTHRIIAELEKCKDNPYTQINKDNAENVHKILHNCHHELSTFSFHAALRFIDRFVDLSADNPTQDCRQKIASLKEIIQKLANTADGITYESYIKNSPNGNQYLGIRAYLDLSKIDNNELVTSLHCNQPICIGISKRYTSNLDSKQLKEFYTNPELNMISTIFVNNLIKK